MPAFTAITSDTSWQDLAIAREIETAYNLRADACGQPHLVAAGTARTVFDFVHEVQEGIERLATTFADPDAELEGQSSLPVRFASVDEFMTSAGLTGSGYWRRIAHDGNNPDPWVPYNDAGWAYGKITDKDLAGPWLWQDIQTALAHMTRILNFPTPPHYNLHVGYAHWGGANPSDLPSGNISYRTGTGGYYVDNYVRWHGVNREEAPYGNMGELTVYSYTVSVGTTSHAKNVFIVGLPDDCWVENFIDFGLGFTFNQTKITQSELNTTGTSYTKYALELPTVWDGLAECLPVVDHSSYDDSGFYLAVAWVIDYLFSP
jgi:hypothetical protein